MSPESFIRGVLSEAGVQIGGDRPWDIQVPDSRAYTRVLDNGSLGFGEAYMDGWIECDRLDQMIHRAYQADVGNRIDKKDAFFALIRSRASTLGSRARSHEIGRKHYDAGNDLFERMLDPYMMYSCGYWVRAENLAQAQEDKLELTCRKLCLKPGMRVLDIGCGWGGFARYAAERFGVEVVGVTVSEQQLELGRKLCEGLPTELRYQDYRELDEQFDRIVSIGMFEHVGHTFYGDFMAAAERCLKDDGIFLLHTVGYIAEDLANPWFDKYIMPGVAFPSLGQIIAQTEDRFVLEDYHNWEGAHYDQTLMAWFRNFQDTWPQISADYDDTFYRMWKLYLQGCAGAFRANRMRVWQLVFAKQSIPGGYAYAHHYDLG